MSAGCAVEACPEQGTHRFISMVGDMSVVIFLCQGHYDQATDPRIVSEFVFGPDEVLPQ